MAKDYYAVLEVTRNATPEEIKRAYRQLARKYHPDVSRESEAEERFKEINEAYEVLADPEKRAMYDRFGTVSPNSGMGGFDFGGGFRDPFDIFAEVFGNLGGFGRGGRTGARRGNDIRTRVELTFEEAAQGIDKEIEFQRMETCTACTGTGAAPGTSPTTCSDCGGSGQVRRVQNTLLGSFVNIVVCPTCEGRGNVVTTPCEECHGSGNIYARRKKMVRIPPGVDDGISIRLAGEGEPGERGGPPGNLYVQIHVKPHPYFKRRGDDVVVELQINVAQAALGSTITVPTLDGERQITVPAGTQAGTVFRLRSLGVPHLRSNGRGDHLVVVQVAVPTHLSADQRTLFQQLSETLGSETLVEEKQSFVDRVKDALGL